MSERVKATVLGVVFLVAGMAVIGVELHTHKTLHVFTGSIGVGFMVLGALVTDPGAVGGALTATLAALKDLLPWRNGTKPPSP